MMKHIEREKSIKNIMQIDGRESTVFTKAIPTVVTECFRQQIGTPRCA